MILIVQLLIQCLNQIGLHGELHFVIGYHALEFSLFEIVTESYFTYLVLGLFVLIRQRSKLALGIFASRLQLGNISLFLFIFLAIMFLPPLMVSFLAPERKS